MLELLWVAAGGALGALMRQQTSLAAARWCPGFPLGTLLVNAVGSFCMGVLAALTLSGMLTHPVWQYHIGVGVLGALTTFSTFSMETFSLLQAGQLLKAGWNVGLNMLLALGGVTLGYWL